MEERAPPQGLGPQKPRLYSNRVEMQAGKRQHVKGALSLLDLPEAVLEQIFKHVPLKERVRTMPLVCRPLHDLDKTSRCLWSEILLPTLHINSEAASARLESFVRWLTRRGQTVRELDLAVIPQPNAPRSQARVWGMLARALAAVAPSVERLHLELMGQLVVGQWASRMVRLRHADLIAQKLVVSTALRGLSNLQDLWLVGDDVNYQSLNGRGAPAGPLLPPSLTSLSFSRASLRALPPGLSSLTSLVSLDLSYTSPVWHIDLGQLAQLRSLQELTCSWCRLETIPRALSGLTALRVLYLHDCFTDVAPPDADFTAALGPLSQLGMLSLSSCRLRSVPSVVAAMTSLRGLHLEDNPSLRPLPPGPYLSRLLELVLDWPTLLSSHAVLAAATRLTRLYASGTHCTPMSQNAMNMEDLMMDLGNGPGGNVAVMPGPGGMGLVAAQNVPPGAVLQFGGAPALQPGVQQQQQQAGLGAAGGGGAAPQHAAQLAAAQEAAAAAAQAVADAQAQQLAAEAQAQAAQVAAAEAQAALDHNLELAHARVERVGSIEAQLQDLEQKLLGVAAEVEGAKRVLQEAELDGTAQAKEGDAAAGGSAGSGSAGAGGRATGASASAAQRAQSVSETADNLLRVAEAAGTVMRAGRALTELHAQHCHWRQALAEELQAQAAAGAAVASAQAAAAAAQAQLSDAEAALGAAQGAAAVAAALAEQAHAALDELQQLAGPQGGLAGGPVGGAGLAEDLAAWEDGPPPLVDDSDSEEDEDEEVAHQELVLGHLAPNQQGPAAAAGGEGGGGGLEAEVHEQEAQQAQQQQQQPEQEQQEEQPEQADWGGGPAGDDNVWAAAAAAGQDAAPVAAAAAALAGLIEEAGLPPWDGAEAAAFWDMPPAAAPAPALPPLNAPPPPSYAGVASSLASMPALRHFVDVFPPGRPTYLAPAIASLMYELPRLCPQLELSVLQSNSFGWRLCDLMARLEEEEQQGE